MPRQRDECLEPTERLVQTLWHGDAGGRAAAARALACRGDSRAARPLLAALGDASPEVVSAATAGLARMGRGAAAGRVLAVLRGQAEPASLRGWGDALPALGRALDHPDAGTCARAAEALAVLGASAPLRRALARGPLAAAAAARALGEIADPRAVPPLLRAQNRSEAEARAVAAEALGRIGDPVAAQALARALTGGDARVALAAARALALLRPPCLTPLVGAFHHPDPEVRRAGAAGLIQAGPAAVDPLLALLSIPEAEARLTAAHLLGELGAAAGAALAPLRDALRREGTRDGRAALRDALARIREALRSAPAELQSAPGEGRGTELEAAEAAGLPGHAGEEGPKKSARQRRPPGCEGGARVSAAAARARR